MQLRAHSDGGGVSTVWGVRNAFMALMGGAGLRGVHSSPTAPRCVRYKHAAFPGRASIKSVNKTREHKSDGRPSFHTLVSTL